MYCIGGLNSCDLAMKRTRRRIAEPAKKWSMKLAWFGARITGPPAGTFSAPYARVRKNVQASTEVTTRVAS